jgi:hypothetical protein
LWWRWNVGTGRREGDLLGPHYQDIRYEDLVASPETTLRAVAAFLELPYAREMVEYHRGKTRHDPDLTAKQAWLPPTQGLRDWRIQMNVRDTVLFEALAGDLLSELSYERRFETIPSDIADVARRCEEQWDREKCWKTAYRSADGLEGL